MPGQTGGELHSALLKKERSAHPAQLQPLVKPDEAVPIMSLSVPHPRLVDERQPAAIEGDKLGAAAELVGLDRRDSLRDFSRLIVDDTGRIAKVNETQDLAIDAGHPILLVLLRPLRTQHAPIGEPAGAWRGAVDASQHLLAPSFPGKLPRAGDAPQPIAPSKRTQILESLRQLPNRLGQFGRGQNLAR